MEIVGGPESVPSRSSPTLCVEGRMPPRTRARFISVIAVMTVMLAGCSAPLSTMESPNGRTIVVSSAAGDVEEQAVVEGTAAWGGGGCLVAEAAETYLIVLPRGTTLGEDNAVTLPGGQILRAGDEIGLGGGFHSADTENRDVASIPEECLTDEIFWASGDVVQ